MTRLARRRFSVLKSNFPAGLVILVHDAIQPAVRAIDAGGVAVGVLVAVVAVVPVEDVHAAVRADLLRHRHEPGIVGERKSPPADALRLAVPASPGVAKTRREPRLTNSSQLIATPPWMLPM